MEQKTTQIKFPASIDATVEAAKEGFPQVPSWLKSAVATAAVCMVVNPAVVLMTAGAVSIVKTLVYGDVKGKYAQKKKQEAAVETTATPEAEA